MLSTPFLRRNTTQKLAHQHNHSDNRTCQSPGSDLQGVFVDHSTSLGLDVDIIRRKGVWPGAPEGVTVFRVPCEVELKIYEGSLPRARNQMASVVRFQSSRQAFVEGFSLGGESQCKLQMQERFLVPLRSLLVKAYQEGTWTKAHQPSYDAELSISCDNSGEQDKLLEHLCSGWRSLGRCAGADIRAKVDISTTLRSNQKLCPIFIGHESYESAFSLLVSTDWQLPQPRPSTATKRVHNSITPLLNDPLPNDVVYIFASSCKVGIGEHARCMVKTGFRCPNNCDHEAYRSLEDLTRHLGSATAHKDFKYRLDPGTSGAYVEVFRVEPLETPIDGDNGPRVNSPPIKPSATNGCYSNQVLPLRASQITEARNEAAIQEEEFSAVERASPIVSTVSAASSETEMSADIKWPDDSFSLRSQELDNEEVRFEPNRKTTQTVIPGFIGATSIAPPNDTLAEELSSEDVNRPAVFVQVDLPTVPDADALSALQQRLYPVEGLSNGSVFPFEYLVDSDVMKPSYGPLEQSEIPRNLAEDALLGYSVQSLETYNLFSSELSPDAPHFDESELFMVARSIPLEEESLTSSSISSQEPDARSRKRLTEALVARHVRSTLSEDSSSKFLTRELHTKSTNDNIIRRPESPQRTEAELRGEYATVRSVWIDNSLDSEVYPPFRPSPSTSAAKRQRLSPFHCATAAIPIHAHIPAPPRPIRPKHKVPPTPRNLSFFRRLSMRPLVEGELLSESDDDIDTTWLVQRHRDMLAQDPSSSLTPARREFYQRFDAHFEAEGSVTRHAAFLGRMLVRFAQEHAGWIKYTPGMLKEFGLEVRQMLGEGVIKEEDVGRCLDVIRSANEEEFNAEQPQSIEEAQRAAWEAGLAAKWCLCGKPVQAAELGVAVSCADAVSLFLLAGGEFDGNDDTDYSA